MIDITTFAVVYICPNHNQKYNFRKHHMENLLKNIGFVDIEHYKSSTENYPDCLSKALIDILEKNIDRPIIVLEDDVEWLGIHKIEYDQSCDAIYLGISKSGGHKSENKDDGSSQYDKWSNTQVRIKNMLATHAILYNSRKYKEDVINMLKSNLGNKIHTDVLISRIQSNYLILAQKSPIFYQSAHLGNVIHVENWTKFEIKV